MSGNVDEAISLATKILGNWGRVVSFPASEGREFYKSGLAFSVYQLSMSDRGLIWEFDEELSQNLVRLANEGDDLAKQAVSDLVADFFSRSEPLPKTLSSYVLQGLDHAATVRKRGPQAHKNALRDYHIASAVKRVIQCGFERARNPATRDKDPDRHSACSIVAKVLNQKFGIDLSEDMVKKAADTWRHLDT